VSPSRRDGHKTSHPNSESRQNFFFTYIC
jgi:hypothetical protein